MGACKSKKVAPSTGQKPPESFPEAFHEKTNTNVSAAQLLMNCGYPLLLFNLLFGLLPIQIHPEEVKHSKCSIPTAYAWFITITMGSLSYIFMKIKTHAFLTDRMVDNGDGTESMGSASDVAIVLGELTYIIGFVALTVSGKRIARKMPGIWRKLCQSFQISVVYFHGNGFRRTKKLKRYILKCFIFYVMVVGANEFLNYVVDDGFNEGVSDYFGTNLTTLESAFFLSGYLLWDATMLSHVYVSMLMTFMVSILYLCLLSVNEQFALLANDLERKFRRQRSLVLGAGTEVVAVVEKSLEEGSEDFIIGRLGHFIECYYMVESLMLDLSKVFGFSLVIEILILLGSGVSNVYFLFVNFTSDFSLSSTTDPIIALFANVNFFFWLAASATKLSNESRAPLSTLKRMQLHYYSPGIQFKLKEFQAHVASSVINLTAADYFVVNKACITSVFGTTLTFVIVLIQFSKDEFKKIRNI